MSWDKERIAQLQLPDPADEDPHPRLLLEGTAYTPGRGLQLCSLTGGTTLHWKWLGSQQAPAVGTYPRRDLRVCVLLACS